ncbi:T9SS type A sorting domain-containing protein [Hwangdonia lutea]|uniref:T9SS type A sorting domain-containing protein n=1 Tax=Hwangdonia lutea TaxID=3075823 RepID=A0AA97EPX2_9FLAO|nr:T9SS type A sorting domain-containing protein [Hwangdonia sp. SCSIO 19198]WOD44080.1 T9SS type A sorting domain-containing protein [Hwangdonia sp. SCSIO 19198]
MKNNYLITLIYICFTTTVFSQISDLSDEFNDAALDPSWNLFQTQYYQTPVPVNNGFMEMSLDDTECNRTCVWWVDMNAGLIYKEVTGDFEVVTAVYTKQKTNPTQDIDRWTQLAGLMARDPTSTTSGNENYVFNVAGIRFDNPSVELKSTTNNTSSIRAYTNNMSGTAAELRMVREGALFSLYSRQIGSPTWMFRDAFNRPDLPETLQVGLIAYVFEAYPGNLLAQFDYIRFSEVTLSDDEMGYSNHQVNMYPNPVKEALNIELKAKPNNAFTVEIYNVLGKKIFDRPFIASNAKTTKIKIALSKLNMVSGIYFFKLKSEEADFGTYKFVVNH